VSSLNEANIWADFSPVQPSAANFCLFFREVSAKTKYLLDQLNGGYFLVMEYMVSPYQWVVFVADMAW
jgi:hypothetical protein